MRIVSVDQESSPLIERVSCDDDFGDELQFTPKERQAQKHATIEEAIEAAGFGWFHFRLLVVCGIMWAADAIEILCVAFVLPAAECDLSLASADKGWLNAIVFVGLLIGGYIGGSLSDTVGRKGILFISMVSNGLFGIASSFMPTFGPFLFLRFLSASGVGAALPVNMPYFAEFQPRNRRGAMVTFLASFFLVGNVIAAGLAWLVIPSHSGDAERIFFVGSFSYASWRLFVALCGVPSTVAGCLVLAFPESPRFLAAHGKRREALDVVRQVWAANQGNFPCPRSVHSERNPTTPSSTFRVGRIISEDSEMKRDDVRLGRSSGGPPQSDTLCGRLFSQTKFLMFKSHARNFWILFGIHFAIAFGYYGLMMWFPELFNRHERYVALHPNATSVGLCEVAKIEPQLDVDGEARTKNCGPLDPTVYVYQLLVAVAPLPTNIWNILHMDVLGRKFFLVLSMVGAGCSVFAIWAVTNATENLLVSMLFSSVSNMGFNSLNCLATELFPTGLRSTAMALTAAALRIGAFLGNIAFGYFIDANCAVPMVLVAVLLTGGGLAGFLLPSTTRTSLD